MLAWCWLIDCSRWPSNEGEKKRKQEDNISTSQVFLPASVWKKRFSTRRWGEPSSTWQLLGSAMISHVGWWQRSYKNNPLASSQMTEVSTSFQKVAASRLYLGLTRLLMGEAEGATPQCKQKKGFLVFWLNSAVAYSTGSLCGSASDAIPLGRLSRSEWTDFTEKAAVLARSLHLTDDTHGALFPGASGASWTKTCVDFILKQQQVVLLVCDTAPIEDVTEKAQELLLAAQILPSSC